MSSFTYTWNNGTPVGTTPANQLDTVIQEMKSGLYERLALEHNVLDGTAAIESASAAGRHKAGFVSAVYIGTTAQITALSSPPIGAIAYDTTVKALKVYNGSSWEVYQVAAGGYAFKGVSSVSTSYVITAGTQEQKYIYQDEVFDDGGAFEAGVLASDTKSRFTVLADGNYYFAASAGFTGPATGKFSTKIYKNGAVDIAGMSFTNNTTNQNHALVCGISKAVVGDYYEVYVRMETLGTYTSLGVQNISYFCGFRVS